MLKKDLMNNLQDKVKVIMKEEFAVSTLSSNGFLFIDEDFDQDRAVLYTCLTDGSQGVKMSDVLDDGDYFIIVPSRLNYSSRARNRINIAANSLIDGDSVLLSTINIQVGVTSRYGTQRHYVIEDPCLININSKKVEGNSQIVDYILPDGVGLNRTCLITQYKEFYTEDEILSKVYDNKISFDNLDSQYDYVKDIIVENRDSKLGTMYGNNIVRVVDEPYKFLTFKESLGSKNAVKTIDQINEQINPVYDKKCIINDMKSSNSAFYYISSGAVAQVDKNITVGKKEFDVLTIRCFGGYNEGNGKVLDIDEFFRLFLLFKDGKLKRKIATRRNNHNKWINTTFPKKEKTSSWSFPVLKLESENFFGELEYIEEIIQKYNEVYREKYEKGIDLQNFISIIEYKDIVEKLYKISDKDLFIKVLANNSYCNVIETIHLIFGDDTIDNDTDLYDAIGFNKQQIKYLKVQIQKMIVEIEKYSYDGYGRTKEDFIIDFLKNIIGETKSVLSSILYEEFTDDGFVKLQPKVLDFRDLDYDTFKLILDFYFTFKIDCYHIGNSEEYSFAQNVRYNNPIRMDNYEFPDIAAHLTLSNIKFLTKGDNYDKLIKSYLKFIELKGFRGMFSSLSSMYMYYNDYCAMVNGINRVLRGENAKDISLSFEKELEKDIKLILDPEELIRVHDELSEVFTLIRDENDLLLYKEIIKGKENLELSDGKFAMILPKETKDIIEEGINLRHCVGSYVQKVLNGQTLILFLREVDQIDKSYFTVELKNGKVVQVRGFSNKSLTDKDAKKFLYTWIDHIEKLQKTK